MRALLLSCLVASGCHLHAQTDAPTTAPRVDTFDPAPVKLRWVAKEFMLPVSGAPQGIDVLRVEVERPGKHPLALLTHGTSDDPVERARVTPWGMFPQAIWFARRGYVVFVVVRKGYGRSSGQQDGVQGGCRTGGGGSFEESGEASADDLRAVAKYAATLPEVDADTIISAGVSTGGFAQVALTAHPPAGLKAAISFAGGRGGDGKEHNCDADGIVGAFRQFGKKSRLPMLWIYSENDHWFPPLMARNFDAAFKKGGGNDQFVMVPPYGDEGHHFFGNISGWSPLVEGFLREQGLLPLADLLPEPGVPDVPPPAGLKENGLKAFHNYLMMGPHKAFATNGSGTFGMAMGQWDQATANKKALDNCVKAVHQGPACYLTPPAK
jgi:dienelactone hydrolase